LAAGLAAVAVDAQFGFPLHAPLSALLVGLALALAWRPDASAVPGAPAKRASAPATIRLPLAAAVVSLAVALGWASWGQASSLYGSRGGAWGGAASELPASEALRIRREAARFAPESPEARRALVFLLLREGLLAEAEE